MLLNLAESTAEYFLESRFFDGGQICSNHKKNPKDLLNEAAVKGQPVMCPCLTRALKTASKNGKGALSRPQKWATLRCWGRVLLVDPALDTHPQLTCSIAGGLSQVWVVSQYEPNIN